MAKGYGRRNQNRPPRKRPAPPGGTNASANSEALASPYERRRLEEELARQLTPLVSADAGLTALTETERQTLLSNYDGQETVRSLAIIQSRLDIAASTTWSETRIEGAILAAIDEPWVELILRRLDTNGRLVPPRSMTQLLREVLESSTDNPSAGAVPPIDFVHLILSVNTEHMRTEYSQDGTMDPDAMDRIEAMTLSLDLEQTRTTLREVMLDEIAIFHSNLPQKREILQADTQRTWFTGWPNRVTDPRLGATPADTFNSANGVELLDVLALGHIVIERAADGKYEFTRVGLLAAGAPQTAVDFMFANMTQPLKQYQSRLARDRRRGEVANQRYAMTEHPFVLMSDGSALLLRYQWALDRFFGSQLYWQTFSSLGRPDPGSTAESFSLAMNDVFEEAVAEVLTRIVDQSPAMTRLIRENELQSAWTDSVGSPPSVCDFVIPLGPRGFMTLDATNHPLNFALAQGLGTIDDYAVDVQQSLVKKCDQIAKTIRQIRRRNAFGATDNSVFVPIVVVPVSGVPNLGTTESDLVWRTEQVFGDLARTRCLYTPTVITYSDLALLEGIAEHYGAMGHDIAETIVGWRRAAMSGTVVTGTPPTSLQDYLAEAGIQRPIPTRTFRLQRELVDAIQRRLAG